MTDQNTMYYGYGLLSMCAIWYVYSRIGKRKEMKGDVTRAIQSISEHITKDGIQLKFKLHSKTPALELLGKHLAMFIERHEGKFKHEYILSMKDFKESNKKMNKDEKSES